MSRPTSSTGGRHLQPALPELVDEADPNVIDDMKVIGAAGGEQPWFDRLNPALPEDEQGNLIYGAQAYDCVITMALAAEAAGTPSPTQQDAIDVTPRDGVHHVRGVQGPARGR